MALNPVNGEHLGGLNAGPHVVINPRVVANLTQYRTEYAPKRKFVSASQKKATRPVFEDAVANAIQAFAAKGALHPVRFDEDDVVVQVYPTDMKLAIIFQRAIAGVVHYAPSFYDVPKPVLDALLATTGTAVRQH